MSADAPRGWLRAFVIRWSWTRWAWRRRGHECPPACGEGHTYRWPCWFAPRPEADQ